MNKLIVFAYCTVLALCACTPSVSEEDPTLTGDWYATRTSEDINVEQTNYHLVLSEDNTYKMDGVRSRKFDDKDYYAKIVGSEREYTGDWEISEDGMTITFTIPESKKNERASNYASMELTVSDDGGTLTRSDIDAEASLLVFTRD